MQDLIARYFECWNETDPGARRALIRQTWTDDAAYTDPMVEARGAEAIDATIASVQSQFPGLVFTQRGTVDAHHEQARFSWGLGVPGEEPLVLGFDVAVAAEDGRIGSVLGFLDKVPG